MALLPVSVDALTRDMAEVDEFLSSQRGYGIFGLTKKQRLMHAGMLISSDYIGGQNLSMSSAAISGTISLIIAQQAAICAAVAASSAAAASSSSSSS